MDEAHLVVDQHDECVLANPRAERFGAKMPIEIESVRSPIILHRPGGEVSMATGSVRRLTCTSLDKAQRKLSA